MPQQNFDVLIVGQGLAGSVLAWKARHAGLRVGLIDRGDRNTSSRVAAGLVTPLTGRRWVKSWRYGQLWAIADAFYRACAEQMGVNCWHVAPALLLREGASVDAAWEHDPSRASVLSPYAEQVGNQDWSIWQMRPAARLDVPAFLDGTRACWMEQGSYLCADFDLQRDARVDAEGVTVDRLECTAQRLVLCRGEVERHASWATDLPWAVVKGELLVVQSATWQQRQCVHHQAWIAPLEADAFLAGATYDRDDTSTQPTSAGREELLAQLQAFVPGVLKVKEQRAALRPTLQDRLPVLGWVRPRIGVMNGLGSKGVLRAPWLADQCVAQWTENRPFPRELSLARFSSEPRAVPARRWTKVAQSQIEDVVRAGDTVIDATTGNGQDTAFLAAAVAPGGTVYALDIQAEALRRASARVSDLTDVAIHWEHCCHSQLSGVVPEHAHGRVAAVMFNLGYLPRGDQQIVTRPRTTVAALQQALTLLKPGGVLTVLAYTGHPGGLEEAEAVVQLLTRLAEHAFEIHGLPATLEAGPPYLFTVWKRSRRRDAASVAVP